MYIYCLLGGMFTMFSNTHIVTLATIDHLFRQIFLPQPQRVLLLVGNVHNGCLQSTYEVIMIFCLLYRKRQIWMFQCRSKIVTLVYSLSLTHSLSLSLSLPLPFLPPFLYSLYVHQEGRYIAGSCINTCL